MVTPGCSITDAAGEKENKNKVKNTDKNKQAAILWQSSFERKTGARAQRAERASERLCRQVEKRIILTASDIRM